MSADISWIRFNNFSYQMISDDDGVLIKSTKAREFTTDMYT